MVAEHSLSRIVRIDKFAPNEERTCGTGYLIAPGLVLAAQQVCGSSPRAHRGRAASRSDDDALAEMRVRSTGTEHKSYCVSDAVVLEGAAHTVILVVPGLEVSGPDSTQPAAPAKGLWRLYGFARQQNYGGLSELACVEVEALELGAGAADTQLHLTLGAVRPEAVEWACASGAIVVGPEDQFGGLVALDESDTQRLNVVSALAIRIASASYAARTADPMRPGTSRPTAINAARAVVGEPRAPIFSRGPRRPRPTRLRGRNAASLLHYVNQVASFINEPPISDAYADLSEWVQADREGQTPSVAIITAPAGWGKSRLALHLCQELVDAGWKAGFADLDRLLVAHLPDQPLFLVIDNAEVHSRTFEDFVSRLAYERPRKPIRILLVARQFPQDLAGVISSTIIDRGWAFLHVGLPIQDFGPRERRHHARAAYAAFSSGMAAVVTRAGEPTSDTHESGLPYPSFLDHQAEQQPNPYAVHLLALLAAQEATSPDSDSSDRDIRYRAERDTLLGAQVDRECQRLGLRAIDAGLEIEDAKEALAVMALIRPEPRHLHELLSASPRLEGAKARFHEAIAAALLVQFPAIDDSVSAAPKAITTIEPSMAVAHLLSATPNLRTIIDRLLGHVVLTRHQHYHANLLEVLLDAAASHPSLAPSLSRVLSVPLAALVRTAEPPIPALVSLLRTHLAPLVEAATAAVEQEQTTAALQLGRVLTHPECRDDATIGAEAVRLLTGDWTQRRRPALALLGLALVQAARAHWDRIETPAGSEVTSAGLAQLRLLEGRWLADSGEHARAYDAANDAVEQYQTLVNQGASRYMQHLAAALDSLTERLITIKRFDEAVIAAQRAVTLYEGLTDIDQARWQPCLAAALNRLANGLGATGRSESALITAKRALELHQALQSGLSDASSVEEQEQPASKTAVEFPAAMYKRIAQAADRNATILNLSGLQLTHLPAQIGELTNLRVLDLSENRISELPTTLTKLTNLREIYLTDNDLVSVPEEVTKLRRLTDLYLNGNRLTTLPSSIANMTDLTILSVNDNELTELPNAIGDLESLTELHLEHNRLNDLPNSVAHLDGLEQLRLNGNRLSPELTAAAQQGVGSVQALLRQIAEEGVLIREGKLILVGEGEVGKTSLLAALCGEPFIDDRDTTHGIEVKPLPLPAEVRGLDGDITLNAWDFGGQEVYRPTHQLFFTAPAVYLVVWKPRQGHEMGAVDYWIDLIRRRTTGSDVRIHVVATHGDRRGRFAHLPEGHLRDKYGPLIAGIHHVDSASGKGIEELKAAITTSAVRLPNLIRRLPASWIAFQDHLTSGSTPYLSHRQYLDQAAAHGLNTESAETLAKVATELGYWCYYPNYEGLDQLVVLKADWLSTAVSLVLDDEMTNDRHGLIDHNRLTALWNDPDQAPQLQYDPSVHPVLLRLMEKYEICYRINRDGPAQTETSLIAQLVDESAPPLTDWDDYGHEHHEQTRICRFVDGDERVIPEGLIYILIVRMHRFSLGREQYRRSVHWKRGLLLDRGVHGRALIRVVQNQLTVTVRAAYPYFFLNQLTEDICDYVRDFWPGLQARIYLTCSDHCKDPRGSRKGTFEVGRLRRRQDRGKLEVECDVCELELPISTLLDGAEQALNPYRELKEVLAQTDYRLTAIQQELRAQGESTRRTIHTTSAHIQSRLEEPLHQILRALQDEAVNGPRLFTIADLTRTRRWRRAIHRRLRIILWCEHHRLPLYLLDRNPNSGVYDIDVPQQWLVRAAPWLNTCAKLLQTYLPIAASAIKLDLDEAQWKDIEEHLTFTQTALDKLAGSTVKLTTNETAIEFSSEASAATMPRGADVRLLHKLLKERDPRFGGLERVLDGGRYLWVHRSARALLVPQPIPQVHSGPRTNTAAEVYYMSTDR